VLSKEESFDGNAKLNTGTDNSLQC
jgi:hypothetical protein